MFRFTQYAVAAALMAVMPGTAFAQDAAFKTGPVFEDFGPHADVDTNFEIPKRAKFAIAYDTAKPAEAGKINRTLKTAARFMNMHVAAGVPQDRIKLAVIVHGKAVFDMANNDVYGEQYEGADNANIAAIEALTQAGVRIIMCGQSTAYHGVETEDLLPGVEMALSAMTAHAVLQDKGYTLNPF